MILTEKTKKLREMRDNRGRIDNKKNHMSEKVQIPSVQNKRLCLYMHCKFHPCKILMVHNIYLFMFME